MLIYIVTLVEYQSCLPNLAVGPFLPHTFNSIQVCCSKSLSNTRLKLSEKSGQEYLDLLKDDSTYYADVCPIGCLQAVIEKDHLNSPLWFSLACSISLMCVSFDYCSSYLE